MEISEDLLCVYSAEVTERNGSYAVEVPEQEVTLGPVQTDTSDQVALVSTPVTEEVEKPEQSKPSNQPPVDEGEIREVEIEDMGDQGDGIARVDRGYVVFVPDTELGDRVTVRITETRENVAFSEVVKRSD
ncbi:TRAM domain-containing protein [Salinigranum halophilum]|uniref:TRAM domain-containing protein n=1 Tax=Salinigranum halophilum TaxID=2565931 RepID=UPI0010A89601|nr:TRAM domain-containing protein [Salinigranum halophilum]